MNLISEYFQKIRFILFNPTLFYRQLPRTGGLSGPLAFALTTHWVGAALSYLWRLTTPSSPFGFQRIFEGWRTYPTIDQPGRNVPWNQFGSHLMDYFFGVTSVITDPFVTLFSLLFSALFIFIGARLLVPSGKEGTLSEVTYESAIRILCYGTAPALFAAVPFFGHGIAWFYSWYVTLIGVKEVYRVSTGNAIVITLFPNLLLLGILMVGLMILSFFFFQFVVAG